jgi:hypothetical protein
MLRKNEIESPNSCLNNAGDDEPIFVLKSTDELAPVVVREWADRYYRSKVAQGGLTPKQQAKYEEALGLADQMDEWRIGNGRR